MPSPTEESPTSVYSDSERKRFMIGGEEFLLDTRYKPMKKIGGGSCGVVCAARDLGRGGKKVAVKKVCDAMLNTLEAKRVLREIKLLRHFRHRNVIHLRDVINPLSMSEFDDVYIVTELLHSDLGKVIASSNALTEDHIAYILYQVLCGIHYVHSAKVAHRDLKPSNILVNADCSVRICDFGLARGLENTNVEDLESDTLTEYVVTRWYRAPEIMISSRSYDFKVDIWSIGCILAEMLLREPLFKGENYVDQLRIIFSIIGRPSDKDLETVQNRVALDFIKKTCTNPNVSFKKLFPKASPEARDLLSKMLVFNPTKRIDVLACMKHPFLAKFFREKDIKSCSPVDYSFEKEACTIRTIQESIYEEIKAIRPYAADVNPFLRSNCPKKKRSFVYIGRKTC